MFYQVQRLNFRNWSLASSSHFFSPQDIRCFLEESYVLSLSITNIVSVLIILGRFSNSFGLLSGYNSELWAARKTVRNRTVHSQQIHGGHLQYGYPQKLPRSTAKGGVHPQRRRLGSPRLRLPQQRWNLPRELPQNHRPPSREHLIAAILWDSNKH